MSLQGRARLDAKHRVRNQKETQPVSYCRRRVGGNAYAITSMRKVELELEFNFLSGSDFLSRVVRQMFSIPFVS